MRNIYKRPVVVTLLALIFAGLVYILAWSSIFSVKSVSVSGAPTAQSENSIRALSGVATGQKLARVEPRAVEHRLTTLAWIYSVDISRNWFTGEVGVTVKPRVPTAFFNGSTIDQTGTVFDLPGFTGGALPLVTASRPKLGLTAIELFNQLPEDFRATVRSVSARDESNLTIRISYQTREIQLLWGDKSQSPLKLEVAKALLELEENKNIRRIDVSAPHAPIVK